MKSKRFIAMFILSCAQLLLLTLYCFMNYINNHEISLSGVAACFGSLALTGGAYMYSETKRPSGYDDNKQPLINTEEL